MTKKNYRTMQEGYYHNLLEKDQYDSFKSRGVVQRYWHRERFKNVISSVPTNKKTILDLGCGPGTLLSMLPQNYKKAVGIDFDEKQIAFAKKKFKSHKKITWIAGDVNKKLLHEKFDCIISSEVIEHIEPHKAQLLVKKMYSLLNTKGTLVITTPNYRSLWPIIEWFVNKLGKVDYEEQHINKMHRKSLRKLLQQTGFTVRKEKTFFIIAPFISPLSEKLAKTIQSIEEKLLPGFGSIMLMVAQK